MNIIRPKYLKSEMEPRQMKTAAILTAAGSGQRLGAAVPKALVEVGGRSLVAWAAKNLVESGVVDHIIVTCPPGYELEIGNQLAELFHGKPGVTFETVIGGETRQASVAAGLAIVPDKTEIILVHDAARPFASLGLVQNVVQAVEQGHPAVIPALPVTDTIKRIDHQAVVETVPRELLVAVQTPQGFRRELLERAHREAPHSLATDDAGLVEALGEPVVVIPGEPAAMKITTPADLAYAEIALVKSDGN